jgi:2-oxoisovalerate dehydrogenase E1 component
MHIAMNVSALDKLPRLEIADLQRAIELYRVMRLARECELRERLMISQNYAHFHVSGEGHEAMACLSAHLQEEDWLHLHYRDKALMLARGMTPLDLFRNLLTRATSGSSGRQMSAHFSHRSLRILSMVGPVGNSALQAVGVASTIRDSQEQPIVVCSVGDGTTQQGEFYEAVAEAARSQLPILFIIEDNKLAISTQTRGRTFFDLPTGPSREFFGIPIEREQGFDAITLDRFFANIVSRVRKTRLPAIAVVEFERLCDHTNADDQARYRPATELPDSLRSSDPIFVMERWLSERAINVMTGELLNSIRNEVDLAAKQALAEPNPRTETATKPAYPKIYLDSDPYSGELSAPSLTMRAAICNVLRAHLQQDPTVILFGQDIEDPKGDVFGVTKGLSSEFPERVMNSPLSESTIIGACIGRALAGQHPVAFIQFADFLPLAMNQIMSELATMYWRSAGQWNCPMIIMITCGAYKPGLGPFHAQTLDSIAAQIPGIDVCVPSSASDAAGLLNAAFKSRRPTLFFYPKACLNLSDRQTSSDVERQFAPLGVAMHLRRGDDLTLVSWGSTITQCLEAADCLNGVGCGIDLIDLRTLSPWDENSVVQSVAHTRRLVIVHEDNLTGGFGAEIVVRAMERIQSPFQVRRVARPDTFIPCNYSNQLEVLPSLKSVLTACADLLELELEWTWNTDIASDETPILAIGSGPSDEHVTVVAFHVAVGDRVAVGQEIAEVEASKSVVSIACTVEGVVSRLFASAGDAIAVGKPLATIKDHHVSSKLTSQVLSEATPILRRLIAKQQPERCETITNRFEHRALQKANENPSTQKHGGWFGPWIADITSCLGSRIVTNEFIIKEHPQRTADEIYRKTGIESRRWVETNETILKLAMGATRRLLDRHNLNVLDIDALIACTSTPDQCIPSLASRLVGGLSNQEDFNVMAYDISVACCGWLFAVAHAHDYLESNPEGRVLVVTSEVLSPLLDKNDIASYSLFADGATATLICGREIQGEPLIRMTRPMLFGKADKDQTIHVPNHGQGFLSLSGQGVLEIATYSLSAAIDLACHREGISISDLENLILHQASKKLLDAVARRTEKESLCNIRYLGNTSSSSIPLLLEQYAKQLVGRGLYGIGAFGGGYTYGASIAKFGG